MHSLIFFINLWQWLGHFQALIVLIFVFTLVLKQVQSRIRLIKIKGASLLLSCIYRRQTRLLFSDYSFLGKVSLMSTILRFACHHELGIIVTFVAWTIIWDIESRGLIIVKVSQIFKLNDFWCLMLLDFRVVDGAWTAGRIGSLHCLVHWSHMVLIDFICCIIINKLGLIVTIKFHFRRILLIVIPPLPLLLSLWFANVLLELLL